MKLKFPDNSLETIEFPLQQPILVRPIENIGLLPADIKCELPRQYALSLVRRRLATVVGALDEEADVTVSDEDVDTIFAAASVSGVVDISAAADDFFEPLLTAEEAAEHLRIHVKTLQRLARESRVPCVRMGKYWRFRLSALDHWVTAQHNQTSQPFRVE